MSQNLQNNQNQKTSVGKRPTGAFLRQPGWVCRTSQKLFCGFCKFCEKIAFMKNAIVFVCSLLLMSPLFAQQKLSVQDCIEMALENNIELKNSQLEIDKARATKNEARAVFFRGPLRQAWSALSSTAHHRIWILSFRL